MTTINLVDNRRYFIDGCESKKYTQPKLTFDKLVKFTNSVSNKLNNKNFEFLNTPKDESFILKVGYEGYNQYIQTGNMIGQFYFKETEKRLCEVNIGLRFDSENSSDILEFLLDYSDSLYTKSIDLNSESKNNSNSNKVVETILIKMFSNSISRAIIMGLPTVYQEELENSYNFRGRVDINQLLAKETPFKGRVPHIKNEKVVVRSISSVILKAIDMIYFKTINNCKAKHKNKKQQKENQNELSKISSLLQIKNHIKQSIKPIVINKQVINDALHHKILNHPSFYEYKNTLKLASWILEGFQEPRIDHLKGESFGYLCDVSKLWENFLVKLIEQNISDEWNVEVEPELKLFGKQPGFKNSYSNKMLPDIILKNEAKKEVMVFDAKFKSSTWFNRDDFYKTVSYISYYQKNGYEVVLSGQIYPDIGLAEINNNIGLFDTKTDFRFFGINLNSFTKSLSNENNFIAEIKRNIGV